MRRTPLDVILFTAWDHTQTDAFASVVSYFLRPGDVVALEGDLGAGKTYLARSFAVCLTGVIGIANSPTFGIVQVYEGTIPVVHIDAYRLSGSEEFERMGGAELFDPEAVTFIEWSERIADSLPRERWVIKVSHVSETSRDLELRSTHRDFERRLCEVNYLMPRGC